MVERAPNKLGRTAIMKLAFLLQTVKSVPLGYDFRLYTYGPFDSDVLNDLGQAEILQAVHSQMVPYPVGYGYEFSTGPESTSVKARAASELENYEGHINWALDEFAAKSASELELLSTIVYADRDALRRNERLSSRDLCRLVREIKPRFPEAFVLENISFLEGMKILLATDSPSLT